MSPNNDGCDLRNPPAKHGMNSTTLARWLMAVIVLAASICLLGQSAVAQRARAPKPVPIPPKEETPRERDPIERAAPLALNLGALPVLERPRDNRKGTAHEIFLKSGSTSTKMATKIRFSEYSEVTKILDTTGPRGWTTEKDATGVTFTPRDGKIPTGELPDPFIIKVADITTGPRYVLAEWIGARNRVLSNYVLYVGEELPVDPIKPDPPTIPSGSDTDTPCFYVSTDSDGESLVIADPDIDVVVKAPASKGLLDVLIDYTITTEPWNLAFTRTWKVTSVDGETGDEVLLTAALVSDVLSPPQHALDPHFPDEGFRKGTARFTLPHPGDYEFVLSARDANMCFNDEDTLEEDDDDTDWTATELSVDFTSTPNPCDSRIWTFTDVTFDPDLNNPPSIGPSMWKAFIGLDKFGTPIGSFPPTGSTVTFNFANLNTKYTVYLDNGSGEPRSYTLDTTPPTQPTLAFRAKVNACGTSNFNVEFTNESKGLVGGCPTIWKWDFNPPSGTGGDTSNQLNPSHIYLIAGEYDVSLTATNGAVTTGPHIQCVSVQHWVPNFTVTECRTPLPENAWAGTVAFETTDGYFFGKDRIEWGFPGGTIEGSDGWNKHRRHVRVCYPEPATFPASYTVKLSAAEQEVSCNTTLKCETGAEFRIIAGPLKRLARKDKVHTGWTDFAGTTGWHYKAKYKYRGSGLVTGGRSFKTKIRIQRKKSNGHWRRRLVDSIDFVGSGKVYTASGGCFTVLATPDISFIKTRQNAARLRKKHFQWSLGRFKARKDDLKYQFTVSDNLLNNPEIISLKLWANDPECDRRQ